MKKENYSTNKLLNIVEIQENKYEYNIKELENKNEELESKIKEFDKQTKKIESKNKKIDDLEKEIRYLKEKLDYLIRDKFMSKSESQKDTRSLFDELEEKEERVNVVEEDEEIKIEFKRKKGRKAIAKNLPVVRVEHDLQEQDKMCECGCQMRVAKEIVSNQYDVVPARFQIIENVRYMYVCKCGIKPKTSMLTPFILPKTQASASLLATIAVQKFEDSLPLHRQAKIFKNRFGVPFNDSTLSNWMIRGSIALEPFMELLKQRLIQNEYIQADETTLQVLNEKNKKATSKSYIWVASGIDKYPVVYMQYSDNRKSEQANKLLQGFGGYLQTDGYRGYDQVVKQEDASHLACWAHARRKFVDISKSGASDDISKKYANEVIGLISKLYKIEKEMKDEPPNIKFNIRQKKSLPIINDIQKWMDVNFVKAIGLGGAIARAFTYLNNQFVKLKVYLENGILHIDNNIAENHIRPIALGRKNWLFATSIKGADAIAIWFSIIESAKANKLEPYFYLKYLLTWFPVYQFSGKNIEALLPWNIDKKLLT